MEKTPPGPENGRQPGQARERFGTMQLIIRKNNRIDVLDALRGIAILAMVFYHGMYDLCDIFNVNIPLFSFLTVLEPPFAGLFILLAGTSSRFSHSNVRRGLRVLAFGMIVTAVTMLFTRIFGSDQSIYFGILHFMGCAILLFEPVRLLADRIPRKVALPLWLALFAVTYLMPQAGYIGFPGWHLAMPASLFSTPWLFPLGFPSANFFSADYFPMIPWFFLFLAGTVIGLPIRERRLPEKFYTARVPFFATAGRNTLLIYVLHQPVIYGLLTLIFTLLHR